MCDDCIEEVDSVRKSMGSAPIGTATTVHCPTCGLGVTFVKTCEFSLRRTGTSLMLVALGGCLGWLVCRIFD